MLAKLGKAMVDGDEVLYAVCRTDDDCIDVVFKDKRKVSIESDNPEADLNVYLGSLNGKHMAHA